MGSEAHIPSYITTRDQLNEVEQLGIAAAEPPARGGVHAESDHCLASSSVWQPRRRWGRARSQSGLRLFRR